MLVQFCLKLRSLFCMSAWLRMAKEKTWRKRLHRLKDVNVPRLLTLKGSHANLSGLKAALQGNFFSCNLQRNADKSIARQATEYSFYTLQLISQCCKARTIHLLFQQFSAISRMRFEKKCVASCRLLATLRDKFDRVTRPLQLAMHFSRQRCVARERWSSSCCRHFDFDRAVGNRTRRSIHARPQLARLQLGKRSAIVQYVAVRPL